MDDLEKIKSKIDIVDLITEHIPLKKLGRNFKTVCPFHSEKTPSFVVSPERQIWHCFGCGKGGDIFGFLIEYDKIDFSEALKYLANKAGIKLTTSVFRNDREKKKENIYTLNTLAANFYNYLLLNHPAGKLALKYLTEERKIPQELVKKFNLGYAPNKDNALVKYLTQKKGYKEEEILDAGLAVKKYSNESFDFFRHRIIFPLEDSRQNIIAFSGRILGSENQSPKYINTRETLVYQKRDTLFGLSLAREEIKKQNTVIVVEGEFDVISSFKEGIKNIVAVKGTSLTESQIKLLKRYAPKILFCFDADPAGTEAQRRSIKMIEEEGVLAGVIIPPEGKDPDEIIKTNPLLFKKAIKQNINIYDFIIDSALKNVSNTKTMEEKREVLDKTLPFLVSIENEVIKEHYLKKLAQNLDASFEAIAKQAEKLKSGVRKNPSQGQNGKNNISREDLLTGYLLSLLIQSPKPKKHLTIIISSLENIQLPNPGQNRLLNMLKEYIESENTFAPNEFVKTLPTELIDIFDKYYLFPLPILDEEKYGLEIEKATKELKHISLKTKLKEISGKIKEKENLGQEEEVEALRKEFDNLTQNLKT
ncbi:DNA primase [Candidatus Parcubacteria bacterium]|nr:MAG: DNA primase [Candidatus Parcubacteria bacterium]